MADAVMLSRKNHLSFVLALTALVGIVAWSFYLSFTRTAILNQRKLLADEVVTLRERVKVLKEQKVESAQLAKSWLDQVEKNEVRWSNVMNNLQKLVPLDVVTKKPKIQFLSYSGTGAGKLTVSAQTLDSSTDPFADVAQLLQVFNNNAFFSEAYVPSLTRGVSQVGNTILNFSFDLVYRDDSSRLSPISAPTVSQQQNSPKIQRK